MSRAVKPLVEDVRPADYFSQKNCALQYSVMLDKAGTPKRKRTSEGAPEAGGLTSSCCVCTSNLLLPLFYTVLVETAEQQIVRQLTEKRIIELNESLLQTKDQYQ